MGIDLEYSDLVATITIQKSPNKYIYERKIRKLDDVLSHAGGLIGIVVTIFFFMGPYTRTAYELSLSNQIYMHENGTPVKNTYNFFHYIASSLYGFIKTFIGCFKCCFCFKIDRYDLY